MDSWTSAKDINTIEAYEIYLSEHANGRHSKFAHAAINKIKNAENADDIETKDIPPAMAGTVAPMAAPAAVGAPTSGIVETKPVSVPDAPMAAPAAMGAPTSGVVETKPEPVADAPAASGSAAGGKTQNP